MLNREEPVDVVDYRNPRVSGTDLLPCTGISGQVPDCRQTELIELDNQASLCLNEVSVTYFHSQTFAVVLPAASTSYSNTPQALFRRASF